MYRLGTDFEFTAYHRLPFETGEESKRHSHDYRLEVVVKGDDLDKNGFLVDIMEVRDIVKGVVSLFTGNMINDMDHFKGRTASLENVARVFWEEIFIEMENKGIKLDEVRIWEDPDNWISYDGSS